MTICSLRVAIGESIGNLNLTSAHALCLSNALFAQRPRATNANQKASLPDTNRTLSVFYENTIVELQAKASKTKRPRVAIKNICNGLGSFSSIAAMFTEKESAT